VTILAVTGLQRERRLIAEATGVDAIAAGGDHSRLEAELERLASGRSGVISIGIAGGLAADLATGTWIVADAVREGDDSLPSDAAWADRLACALPEAVRGSVLGVNVMVAGAAEKAELHRATGAVAVDMESHIVARVARRHGLAFAAARVVCDPAQHDLPPAAQIGLRRDGRMDVGAVLASLLARPGQLPALLRTAVQAERAFSALVGGCRRLGRGLAGPDFGKPALDVT
jgi:hopanoid-associated phosphorylase